MADNRKYAQLQTFSLAGAGAIVGATSITLKSMLDIDGVAITMSSFGTKGYATMEPGNGENEEQISFTGLVNNVNGTTTLTGIHNVAFLYPYTETSGLLKTHAGSTVLVISNTSGFYDNFANKNDAETINQTWTFGAVASNANPKIDDTSYSPSDADYITKAYGDAHYSGGGGATSKVKVNSSDTTENYLDNKIQIVSADSSITVTKTIQNPSGNEKISYDLSAVPTPVNPSAQGFLFDDFCGGYTNGSSYGLSVIGDLTWHYVGAGAIDFSYSEDGHPGIFDLPGDGASTAGIELNSSFWNSLNNASTTIEFLVRLTGTSGYNAMIGIASAASAFSPTGTMALVLDSGNWKGRYTGLSGDTTVGSIAATTNWVKLKMVTDGTGANVQFFVDGVSLGSLATDAFTGQVFPVIFNSTGSTDVVRTDYFYFNQSLTR